MSGLYMQFGAGRNSSLDHGLSLFSQLICNKIFLLSFIRTLEQRSDFIARDKVNVASLVCVALHTRLDYLTELVFAFSSFSSQKGKSSVRSKIVVAGRAVCFSLGLI